MKQEPAAFPNCRSRRSLSAPGPVCTKPWKTVRSMPSACARSLWTSRRCLRQGSSFFWGWTPATCIAQRPRRPSDRTLVPIANLPKNTHAASPGWVMSHVVLLPQQAGQGTFVLDTARVASRELATEVAARQLRAVVALLVARGLCPIILGDRWYACAPFLARMADRARHVACCASKAIASSIVRLPRVLPDRLGPAARMGTAFNAKTRAATATPDETWEGVDAKGARIEVRCWNHLHLRTARSLEVSVIQIIRHGASGKARDPKISWFVWKGDRSAPLAQISPTYRLRYSHEHGYRFDKQELLWDVPRLSTPERTERWTQVVACAHNLLGAGSSAGGGLLSTVGDAPLGARRWRRCDGPCPPFCSSWAHPLDHRNCVEKRRDGPKAFIPSPGHVIR